MAYAVVNWLKEGLAYAQLATRFDGEGEGSACDAIACYAQCVRYLSLAGEVEIIPTRKATIVTKTKEYQLRMNELERLHRVSHDQLPSAQPRANDYIAGAKAAPASSSSSSSSPPPSSSASSSTSSSSSSSSSPSSPSPSPSPSPSSHSQSRSHPQPTSSSSTTRGDAADTSSRPMSTRAATLCPSSSAIPPIVLGAALWHTKETEDMQSKFPEIDIGESVLDCYSCSHGGVLNQGTLYITQHWFLFSTPMDKTTRVVLQFCDIIGIEQQKGFLASSIIVSTCSSASLEFSRFLAGDEAFAVLKLVWDKGGDTDRWYELRDALSRIKYGKSSALGQFQKIFRPPPYEVLVEHFACSVVSAASSIPSQGRVYLSKNFLCFHAVGLRGDTVETISINSITNLEKNPDFFDSGIDVRTASKLVRLRGFTDRDFCFGVAYLLWQRRVNRPGMFGIALPTLLANEGREEAGIPLVVELGVQRLLEIDGFGTEGIFRISAAKYEIDFFVERCNEGYPPDFSRINDPHLVGDIVKRFFHELDPPLFTYDLYNEFVRTSGSAVSLSLSHIDGLLKRLPPLHLGLLKFLAAFLCSVADRNDVNRMTHRNLATVFAPLLLRPKDECSGSVISESMAATKVLHLILVNRYTLFPVLE